MKPLREQVQSYATYHQDYRNTITHFVGVPLVTFALFLGLGWFRFVHAPEIPLTAATVFYALVLIYYVCLDWMVALLQVPFSLALLWLADRAAVLPFGESLVIFLAAFLGGWAIQILGHVLEGRRPALTDNILQIFNAPLFLTVEALCLFGFRKDLRPAPDPDTEAGLTSADLRA